MEDIYLSIFFILILALDGSLNHLSCTLTIAWLWIKDSNGLKSNLLPIPLALIIIFPSVVFKAYNLGDIK
jgi:hypothetical protein